MVDQFTVITDTSVLVNFLVLDRVPLLASFSGRKFVITDHVRNEITDHYPAQQQRLEQALSAGLLEEISVTDLNEVALFAKLTATGLGIGECSAIAVAVQRQWSIAIDDNTARKRMAKLFPALAVLVEVLYAPPSLSFKTRHAHSVLPAFDGDPPSASFPGGNGSTLPAPPTTSPTPL